MLCSLYSLYDAISLAGGVLEGRKLYDAHFWLGEAKNLDFEALKKHPLAKETIRDAIRFKRRVVKIIYKHAPQPPKPADCHSQAGVAPQLPGFYEFQPHCPGEIKSGTFWLPWTTITGKAGYVTPKGERQCPHDRHEVDCKGMPRGTRRVTFFAETTPAPQPGDVGLIAVILRGNRVGVVHSAARALSAPFQPAPSLPPVHCTGSISLLSGGPPPVSGYAFSCDRPTTGFALTLPSDRSFLNATTPAGYNTCTPRSVNGGTNNELHCDRASGVTPAGQSVNGQIQTNQRLAAGSVMLTVSPQNATFSLSGP
jgi:hypothetical protein